MSPVVTVGSALGLSASLVVAYFLIGRSPPRGKTYPPSPPGLPLLGNLLDIPKLRAWQRFAEWSQELCSPIITINVLGTKLIVINDPKAVEELLEKRSAIYCSRPRMPYVNEAAGFEHWNWGFSGNPEFWKPARRELETQIRQSMVRHYHDQQIRMALHTMRKMLREPGEFWDHCRFASGSFILDMMYGMSDPNEAASYVNRFDRGLTSFAKAVENNVVDFLPLLRHVPTWLSWLPGFRWRREVETLRRWGFSMRDATYDWYKLHKVQSSGAVIDDVLVRFEASIHDEAHRIAFAKDIVGVAYVAGTTTLAAFRFIVLVFVLFPEVQRSAREQVDSVVGGDRLPSFDDKPRLPYVVALCKEIIRWTSPVAIPHSPIQDDYYDGYFIPKGSRVIPNTWAVLHDASVYPSPEEFRPGRFLTPEGELDPMVPDPMAGFGYGRRICPGRFIALDEMFIFTAFFISLFDIKCSKDVSGEEIMPDSNAGEGLVGQPSEFPCIIEPRPERTQPLLN